MSLLQYYYTYYVHKRKNLLVVQVHRRLKLKNFACVVSDCLLQSRFYLTKVVLRHTITSPCKGYRIPSFEGCDCRIMRKIIYFATLPPYCL